MAYHVDRLDCPECDGPARAIGGPVVDHRIVYECNECGEQFRGP